METTATSASGLIFGPSVSVFIKTNASLTITGNTTFSNNSIINIENAGSLIINGNLENKNNGNEILVNGQIQINGNYTGGNGSVIIGSGSFSSTGSAITAGTGRVFCSTDDCNAGPCYRGGSCPLPIELLSFNAVINSNERNTVNISWITASETNNDYFTLEKSSDGVNFEFVGTIDGGGNKIISSVYSFMDNYSINGALIYRLKQTDFDGKFSYSNLVTVNKNSQNRFVFSVFPNPSDGENIFVSASNINETGKVSLVLYNSFGSLLYTKEVEIINGELFAQITTSERFQPGVYFIIVSSTDRQYKQNLIINY